MTAGTPEHDVVHSGSRWEPAAGGLPGPVPPPPVTQRRPRRGRRALVGLAALSCLLLGGVGGYLLGHAAGDPGSGAPTPAGSTGGIPGAGVGGPGDGDRDGDGGGFRHHDGTGPGATPPTGGDV